MSGWLRLLLVAVAIYALIVAALVAAGRRTAAKEIARLLPNLVRLLKALLADPRVPKRSRWLLGLAAAWVASPIDLIPEFIPFLGPLDDAVVVALVLRHIIRRAGPDVVREHWRGDPRVIELLIKPGRRRRGREPRSR